MEMYRAELE